MPAKSTLTAQRLRQTRIEAGLCTKCGKSPPVPDIQVCLGCQRAIAETKKRFYARRAAAGLCVDCGKVKPKGEKKVCEPCCLKRFNELRPYVYGITAETYYALVEKQGGVCAICHKPSTIRLAVDHDHKTGKVRGLLCSNCNTGIGMFKDDPARLKRAAEYLTEG